MSNEQLIQVLWDMYFHMELEQLDQINSNDHPRLIKLAEDLKRRLSYEGLKLTDLEIDE